MKNLGEKIKQIRTEKGLSQPQLANEVGVSKGIISIWENNINEPKATYLKNLAMVLDVSADYLLGLEDESGAKTSHKYNIGSIHNSNINMK